ncbi:hypothetical protein RAB70_21190 [Xanthomonas sontii]|uniref:hypothetical protein n=1 Tax=Xanthomonas sontii TaxID=2650745 RepID=UPI0011E609EC|nr:hypothetical protein [Xanthomonas sontii]MDQ7761116.1 hypothetical protein [Xanthomonas sontii]UZK08439.1 hypothetical protein CJ027_017935 [Xanthomonas sontii]
MDADPERVSAEGARQGVLDQPSAVVKRFFWLLFFAQAKKSNSPQGESFALALVVTMADAPTEKHEDGAYSALSA